MSVITDANGNKKLIPSAPPAFLAKAKKLSQEQAIINGSTSADTQLTTSSPVKTEDVQAASTPPTASKPKTAQNSTKKPRGSWNFTPTDFIGSSGPIGRQMLPFMFEIEKNNKPDWQFLLPINPENYRMTYTPRAVVTHTQSGLFEDMIGQAPPGFTIAGVFGLIGTSKFGETKGVGFSLDKSEMTGLQLYHEFEQNMLAFYELFGTHRIDGKQVGDTEKPKPEEKISLRFFNFCDKEFWKVQINQFTLTRNIQRRHLYQYEIQMTGLIRLGPDASSITSVNPDLTVAKAKLEALQLSDKKLSAWDSFLKAMKSGDPMTMLKGLTSGIGKIMSEVNSLKAKIREVTTAIAAFKNGLTDLIHAPGDILRTGIELCREILDTAGTIQNLPYEFIKDIRDVQRSFMALSNTQLFVAPSSTSKAGTTSTTPSGTTTAGTDRTEIAFAGQATNPQSPSTLAQANALEMPTARPTSGSPLPGGFVRTQIPEETIFADELNNPVVTASKTAAVSSDDTIATIAKKTGSDWKQIVTLNGLDYPYIAKTTEELFTPARSRTTAPNETPAGATAIELPEGSVKTGDVIAMPGGVGFAVVSEVSGYTVTLENPMASTTSGDTLAIPAGTEITVHDKMVNAALPGQWLLIPSTDNIGINVTNETTQEDLYSIMYGVDEWIDDGEIHGDYRGDIASISGISNLEMQLQHRLLTLKGELSEIGHPDYGSNIPLFIGKMSTPVWHERILLECKMTCLADPRVESISSERFVVENDAVLFTADVLPKNYIRPITVNIPVG